MPAAVARRRDPDCDPAPDLSDYVNPGKRPTLANVIERLHQAGVRTGLGAFNPPGTRPPLVGLAVPEDSRCLKATCGTTRPRTTGSASIRS